MKSEALSPSLKGHAIVIHLRQLNPVYFV